MVMVVVAGVCRWDQEVVPITAGQVHDALMAGTPSIQTHASGPHPTAKLHFRVRANICGQLG